MNCRKCARQFDDEFQFCPYCGKPVLIKRKHRRRANGEGAIRKRGSTYSIRVVVGWRPSEAGFVPVVVERGGLPLLPSRPLEQKARRRKRPFMAWIILAS